MFCSAATFWLLPAPEASHSLITRAISLNIRQITIRLSILITISIRLRTDKVTWICSTIIYSSVRKRWNNMGKYLYLDIAIDISLKRLSKSRYNDLDVDLPTYISWNDIV